MPEAAASVDQPRTSEDPQPATASLRGVDVDPATGQRGTKLVEPGQAGFRFGLIGGGDGQDQGLNDDERGGVARDLHSHWSVTFTECPACR